MPSVLIKIHVLNMPSVLIKMCKSSTPESKWNFLEEKFIDQNLEVILLKSLQIYLIATDK